MGFLVAREDYSTFNLTDHHKQIDTNSSDVEPTKTNVQPQPQPPTVTTIIIIQSNGQTYHQLGGGGGGGGPSPTNSGDGMTDPNNANIQDQVDHDNKVLKRLISISTVVGGVGIILIIAGSVIFIRLRSKRRRMKAMRQCQHSSPSSSIMGSQGGNNTAHRRNQSSLSSTTTIPPSPTHGHEEDAIEMPSTLIPSAPPEPILLPTPLRSRYQHSLLPQQQSSSPAPSAPSAKELEMNVPSSSRTPSVPSIQVSPPSASIHDHNPLDTIQSMTLSQSSRTIPTLHLKPMAGIHESNSSTTDQSRSPSTPELPPPAYTPSAPPLFILPPSQRRRSADQLSLDRYRRYQ